MHMNIISHQGGCLSFGITDVLWVARRVNGHDYRVGTPGRASPMNACRRCTSKARPLLASELFLIVRSFYYYVGT